MLQAASLVALTHWRALCCLKRPRLGKSFLIEDVGALAWHVVGAALGHIRAKSALGVELGNGASGWGQIGRFGSFESLLS